MATSQDIADLPAIPEVGYTDDLSTLSILDEDTILEELGVRFQDGVYYTFIGDVLVAINPYKPVLIYNDQYHEWYSDKGANQKPHIFWTAQQVHRSLIDSKKDQCVLVNGESGAGKTESTKLIVRHLVHLSSVQSNQLHEKIVCVNPLLESFGNAATVINENSSRFGKFIQLNYDDAGKLNSALITEYMLEKSRLVSRGKKEKNFHIFYYLLAGLTEEQRSLYLLQNASAYRILKSSEGDSEVWTKREFKSYKKAFSEQMEIMRIVGFTEEAIITVVTILAAILHLTNTQFVDDTESNGVEIQNELPMRIASCLLGLNKDTLSLALTTTTATVRGEQMRCMKNKVQAENGRDALAKALYSGLFKWIVGQINMHLQEGHTSISSGPTIGILDMAGFEDLPQNGFEQLCINAANERLQQYFVEVLFDQELRDYKNENIQAAEIQFNNNNPIVELLFLKPTGLFHIIDEESMFPGASDSSLKDKLDQVCSTSQLYVQLPGNGKSFAINHYAGKVTYDVDGMLERNRDGLNKTLVECLSTCDNDFVKTMASSSELEAGTLRSQDKIKVSGLTEINTNMEKPGAKKSEAKPTKRQLQRRSQSIGNLHGGEMRQSGFVSRHFRRSLSELMHKMSDSKPWFVRCVKPNSKREPDIFDFDLVREQLRYNGLLQVSQLRRDGYAIRMFPEEFIHRYRDIAYSPETRLTPTFDICEQILREAGIQGYAFGKRQVFLRHWHRPVLQDLVSEKRKMMAMEQNSVLSDNAATDLDTTYDMVAESQIHNLPVDAIAIEASPVEEITIETGVTGADPHAPKRTGSCTSTSSRQRVTEWIKQNEQLKTDVKIPPYDPGPPPTFSTQQEQQVDSKTHHVRISLPTERKVLDTRLWDRFQMIPRERVSTSDTFRPFLRAFKFFCYVLIFCVVLGSAVVNKLCILLMTSSVLKDEKAKEEGQTPTHMMLIISICFPYCFWVLSYSAKSLFGSSAWPSFRVLVVTLFLELLHSFGLCLLVFHILPKMDMARGLLNICGIFTVPAFLKSVCVGSDKSLPGIKRFTLTAINGIAFMIQFCNLAATTMFSIPLTEAEKSALQTEVVDNSSIINSIERPVPVYGSRLMWEIPVSLFLISLSYWENYVDSDISICSLKIPLLEWKKNLHTVRQRLYIFAGIWKIGWTMVFAVLLLPGFNFNMEFSDTKASLEKLTTVNTILTSDRFSNGSVQLQTTPPATFMNATFATNTPPAFEAMTTKTLSSPYRGGGRRGLVKRSITDAINKGGINAVLNLTENTLPKTATNGVSRENTIPVNDPTPSPKPDTETNEVAPTGFIYIEIPESVKVNFQRYGPLYAQLLASAILSYFGSLACKLCMQTYGFTVPLFLATPITLGIVIAQCYTNFLPSYLYIWMCPEMEGDIRLFHLLWLGILWISQIIVTAHIWSPKNGRMAKVERLFVTPLRCGVLTDLSLMLRRRLNDRDFSLFNVEDDWSTIYDDEEDTHRADDVVPQIYACATMWHETRSEMTQLLKSLFRMDTDHSARYLAQRFYGIRDPDYYEFEAHIFFDDAMDLSEDDVLVPNSFVAELIDCIDDAISSVHERQMQLGPPVRTPTPYGGRLTWRLPGATKLIVHLKDKHKIRHKKRWSQVMYMYYLLGYRILAQPENLLHREATRGNTGMDETDTQRVKLTDSQLRHRRQASHFTRSVIFNYTTEEVHTQAENTFILTLDGDVDFKPDAVRLLVDRLKKNKKVGAACGRIHPVGSGPILWYQEFEYAIGHWLQKATEHVFGCVLCAPGCFSLFRGSALMDDNVTRCYAIRASEAGHYVQYDQGEDRWLSTLLLQQGYRIDYCAAADALTHAPETFSEFFNQRRRWGPSTLANIVDLLGDWKNTVRLNDNISTPYILYQFFLLVSTILGPATVLLMMAGAFTVVFKTSVVESYAISLLPAIAFIVVCIYTKPSTQITVATILSAVYAIIMTIVLVGTVGTAIQGDLTSPNVVFLMMLVIIFFIAALMHPEEFTCVIPGALYFICIPTGYLLLTIYYLSNMHIVSWGTREVPKRKSREQILAEKIAEEEKRKKKEQRKGMLGWLGLDSIINETVEIFRQLRTMTMTKSESKSKTDDLLEELIYELRQTRDLKAPPRHRTNSTMTTETKEEPKQTNNALPTTENTNKENADLIPVWLQNEDPENPGWLRDCVCGDGPIRHLEHREDIFWKQLIRKYVNPINEDKVHQEKVAADLKNLRNNTVFGFFMTSALWIALTMQLQLLQDEFKDTALFIKIPHFDSSKKELTFEPLGMIFLALFSSILFFQFIGMLSHRWGTILHVLSITDVSCSQKFTERNKIREVISKVLELQRVSNIENEPEPDYDDPIPDYDDETGEDEDETLSTLYTDSSSSIVSFSKPPSYHSQDGINRRSAVRRKNSAIFNRRGMATGRTLRRAFERRYRNQLRREKSADSQQNSGIKVLFEPERSGFESV